MKVKGLVATGNGESFELPRYEALINLMGKYDCTLKSRFLEFPTNYILTVCRGSKGSDVWWCTVDSRTGYNCGFVIPNNCKFLQTIKSYGIDYRYYLFPIIEDEAWR